MSSDPPRGRFRAFYDWLKRGEPLPEPAAANVDRTREYMPARVGHYRIERKLGEGGMGVVYAARDERLERTVALKMMSSVSEADTARRRFWREARAAASVNHPHICQIYEIGEDQGQLFIAMEMLEGEPLSVRLSHGPMAVTEALSLALEMLAALTALHARGIVHRDLKPSNVFLTPYGMKLLDFGLARPEMDPSEDPATALTRTGMVVGTPRYMAPEQVMGDTFDARGDLFAAGAILFEMLAGRPAFTGRTVVEILHATVYEQPPALTGSPAVAAVDRVIRQALSKKPEERPSSADEMAAQLREIRGSDGSGTPALARPLTRLVVLPFRVLRSDPETDFLAFSLPDAIATSLAGIGSLIVRSSATAARFARTDPDLKELAAQAEVDRVVMGTLLRSGDEVRAVAQLVEAPSGTLLTSHTVQASLGDLFRLQDDIVRGVVGGLSSGLTGERPMSMPTPDRPKNSRAYEFYLRANELARKYDGLLAARELYQQCLALDPDFAPAWAYLGRCQRVIGKFVDGSFDSLGEAETALRRALDLNPRLSVAHKFYANLEADLGQAPRALVRLLDEAARHGNDPEIFAGLVHACRYCGLFDEAIAAHVEARRLDPNVATGLVDVLIMCLDLERLAALEPPTTTPDEGTRIIALGLTGRKDEARRMLIQLRNPPRIEAFHKWVEVLTAWLNGRGAEVIGSLSSLGNLSIQGDPEALFLEGWILCDAGEHQAGFEFIQRAVTKGYFVVHTLKTATQFDSFRGTAEFQALMQVAESGRQQALDAFRKAGGERLLGTKSA